MKRVEIPEQEGPLDAAVRLLEFVIWPLLAAAAVESQDLQSTRRVVLLPALLPKNNVSEEPKLVLRSVLTELA